MKSSSVFQWLSKNKPSLCKPAPPLFGSPHPNSPLPFAALGKTSRDLIRKATKEEIFFYLHCTSTNGCQMLRILGNSNSTDPILWMTLKDGAHRYPAEQSPRRGLMAAQWVRGNCLVKSVAQPTPVCVAGKESANAGAVAAREVGAASTAADAQHPLHPFLPSKWLWEISPVVF